jgi:cytochrome P450 PksS
MWVVTRYDDARMILNDRAFGKDLVKVRDTIKHCLVRPEKHAKLPRPLRRSMFEQDGATHRRLRGLLNNVFTRERMSESRPQVERIADELLDGLAVGEPVDLVRSFTRPLATNFLSDLVGVPKGSRDQFPDWENSILTATSAEEASEAGRLMYAFCREMVELKRAQPRDDLFTRLVEAEREGKLDEEELVATVFLLLIGGVEPTSAIANATFTLLTHPAELARLLDDPSLLPGCVEEVLRYETSFRILPPRHCPHAVQLDGVTIPAHELVIVANSAANRDPSVFENPHTFDITRPSRRHLAFGYGPHRCLGAELGRLEMTVALGKLFERFPHTRLAEPADKLRWRPATFLRRLESLPVLLA